MTESEARTCGLNADAAFGIAYLAPLRKEILLATEYARAAFLYEPEAFQSGIAQAQRDKEREL